jgi:uncharacterized protein
VGLVVLMLAGGACSRSSDTLAVTPTVPPTDVPALHAAIDGLPTTTVRFARASGSAAELRVRVAQRPAERAQGLKGVRELPQGVGMLFLFPEAPAPGGRGGFWMFETLVALDIAFVADGEVVGVATMQPCVAQPCPITHPGVEYDAAVETAAGWLVAAGVEVGTAVAWTLPPETE